MRSTIFLLFILYFHTFSYSQSVSQEKMKQLNFLVGNWKGISTSFKDGKVVSKVKAEEKISYGLDGHILKIDLDSETLQLHTVIYFDEKEEVYYYNPFYKNGAATYKAEFKNGKFIVNPSKTKRFVFCLDSKGRFVEYGETLENGKWTKYFEDIFTKE